MNKLLRNIQDYNIFEHLIIRDVFKWGTYGKELKDPLKYAHLKNISNAHLINILMNCNLEEYIKELFLKEVYFRLENPSFSIFGDTVTFIEN